MAGQAHRRARAVDIKSALSLLAAALIVAGSALAADSATRKTYRWVDKDGVVQFGDHIPAEYASTNRQVLNEYGVAVGNEQGARTPEQLAAEKDKARKAEEERQKAILAARRDQVLLDTYLSVDEIESLRDRRLELIDTQIKVTENFLQGLRDILAKLQSEAAAFKPYSSDPNAPPIDERLARELSTTMDSILLYEKNLKDSQLRKTEIAGRFAADINRFRELKATETPR
jgi:hypothetical protein